MATARKPRKNSNPNKERNMAMLMESAQRVGLSPNQARALVAEIGRENSYQDRYLWGYHKDPGNGALNLGLISWQGKRGRNLEKVLQEQGLIKNGVMEQSQRALDAQMRFLVNEIRTDPTYSKTKKLFLENPNVDYATANRVLGKDFIRWRYDDPKYAMGHKTRDIYWEQLGGVTPKEGGLVKAAPDVAQQANVQASLMPTQSGQQTDLLGKPILAGSVGFAVPETPTQTRLYNEVAEQGLSPQKEPAAVVAADTISKIYDQVFNQPLVKSSSPHIDALMQIFNNLEV